MADEADKLSKQFLRMYPLKDLTLQPVIDHLLTLDYEESIKYQQELLCCTLHHPIVLKYPPTSTYCQRFTKMLITKIEEINHEVCDDIYEAYTNLISQSSIETTDGSPHCYRTYFLPSDVMITLKETQKIISEGTTGMFTWEASHVLANWCQEELRDLRSKSVLELGAGLGLTGLSIIKNCNPDAYTFTDLHATVLKTLKENISINLCDGSVGGTTCLDSEEDFKIEYKGTDVSVVKLDWNTDHVNDCYDIILAADVVYDTEVISPLIEIIKEGLSKKEKTVAHVASTIRNSETFDFFKNSLATKGVKISSESHHMYMASPSQPECTVVLLQLNF